MTKLLTLIGILVLVLSFVAAPVMPPVASAYNPPPDVPAAFYGTLTVSGAPAPVGSIVIATGQNVMVLKPDNPLVTTEVGKYGGPGLNPKLTVQGYIAEGIPLTFWAIVNGVMFRCNESAPWHAGTFNLLNLTA